MGEEGAEDEEGLRAVGVLSGSNFITSVAELCLGAVLGRGIELFWRRTEIGVVFAVDAGHTGMRLSAGFAVGMEIGSLSTTEGGGAGILTGGVGGGKVGDCVAGKSSFEADLGSVGGVKEAIVDARGRVCGLLG